MNKPAVVLSLLLVATNVVWWLRAREPAAPAASPAPTDDRASDGDAALSGQGGEELAAARARIAELEAQLQARARVAAPGAANGADDARQAERAAARQARDEARRANAERMQRARGLAEEWTKAALQTTDLHARDAALAAVRAALAGGDPDAQAAALTTIAGIRELDYDKAALRPLVLPLLQSPDERVRAASLFALLNTATAPDDVGLVAAMANDASATVRGTVGRALLFFANRVLEGEVAATFGRLLDDPEPQVRRDTLASVWGARVSTDLERRFLAMANEPQLRHDAVYFGLSTFAPKSSAVVEALLRIASESGELSGRARWGLRTGVGSADAPRVADGALALLESRSDPTVQRDCFDLLQRYGGPGQIARLETFAARPGVTRTVRETVQQLITQLQQRPR